MDIASRGDTIDKSHSKLTFFEMAVLNKGYINTSDIYWNWFIYLNWLKLRISNMTENKSMIIMDNMERNVVKDWRALCGAPRRCRPAGPGPLATKLYKLSVIINSVHLNNYIYISTQTYITLNYLLLLLVKVNEYHST